MNVKLSRIERLLIPLVGLACRGRLLIQALGHASRIYPGSDHQSSIRRCRFLVRTAWYRSESSTWFAFLEGSVWRKRQVIRDPELAEHLHRPSRRSDLSARERLSLAIGHWQLLEGMPWSACIERPLLLATLRCKDGVDRQLVLTSAGRFNKEGGCCLHLQCGDDVLFSLVFSLSKPGDASQPMVLDVGCLQGPLTSAGKDSVRQTTKALYGLRPRELLLSGLRAVGATCQSRWIVGVGSKRHVYRHWRKRRQISFDYDKYWAERGGVRNTAGDFEMSVAEKEVKLDDVPSRKRAEFKRRQHLLKRMRVDIMATLDLGTASVVDAEFAEFQA